MAKTIQVSDETYELIKEQLKEDELEPLEMESLDDLIGEKWFFRTVTNYMVGKVTKRIGKFLVLEKASWIGDTSRFSDFIKNGVTQNVEVEPVGSAIINMDSIVDAFPWIHSLPTKQQ
jgi:hypothetical protein